MPEPTISIEAVHEIRDTCLCFATQRAARRLARRFDRAFAGLGITNGQFSMMVALSGPWRPKLGELAGFLDMDPTTVTAALKPLRERGLIELRPDEADLRVRRPVLTGAGHATVAQAAPIWREEHRRLAQELAGGDAAGLSRRIAALG